MSDFSSEIYRYVLLRFRDDNNLFHGVKNIYGKRGLDEIYDQEDNFYHANRLLLEFVKLKRNGKTADIAT